MRNERYDDLMWRDDGYTYGVHDKKGHAMNEYIKTISKMRDEAEPEDDAPDEEFVKWCALDAAYLALCKEYNAKAKEYCDHARDTEGFKEYEKEHFPWG